MAALTASAVFVAGCTASVDPDELPGLYRNEKTGGEILLGSDGTFSATDVSTDGSSDPADFQGSWEFLDSQESSDFVYLKVKDGGLGVTAGIQLYTRSQDTVYFRDDPDGPPSLVLKRVTAP
ncbi:hypothetical protein [Streptomyces sp. WM4235]|uniref:hypothetical protein n=1 Tax=Streptomyces sp. WM4235 TaxID=1415551 RepID=UPI001F1F8CF9|nr:hypothetical protein [Streptomyces sp. WM4235]